MAWYDAGITQGFKWSDRHKNYHSGVDLGAAWNTPVTAPLGGRVLFASCTPWGGQVDVAITQNGLPYVMTVLHLHSISVSAGQVLAANQLLGYSGGDGRGPCPTQMPKYSNGPHIHFEVTLGNVGPYHGGPPYRISANSTTVDPLPLLSAFRSGVSAGIFGAVPGIGSTLGAVDPNLLLETPVSPHPFDTLFALPEATVTALDAIPGIENLIYKLHEVESFPGWKSLDQVAPLGNAANTNITVDTPIPGVKVSVPNPLGAVLNPGRLVYWIVGNVLGNFRAFSVRTLYLVLGSILFLGLMIALGQAQIATEEAVAGQVSEAVKPLAEAAGTAAMVAA